MLGNVSSNHEIYIVSICQWVRRGVAVEASNQGCFSSIAQLDPSCKWVNSLRHLYLVEPSSSRSLSTPSCELSRFYHEMRVIHHRGPKITGVWLDSSHGPSLQMSKSSSMIWVNRSLKRKDTAKLEDNEQRDRCVGKCREHPMLRWTTKKSPKSKNFSTPASIEAVLYYKTGPFDQF